MPRITAASAGRRSRMGLAAPSSMRASCQGRNTSSSRLGQPINVATTTDPNNPPPPVSGDFNLELVLNATGTGSYMTAPGYQGLAIRSADGHTLTMLHGDYGVVDNGAGNLILLGDGSESIGGAIGDTIQGGSGPNQFLDGHLGHQSITGGTAGNETIWGAATDTVRGGSGGNETIAGVPGETTFGSSGANVFINATGGNQSVRGGSAGNDSVWTAAGDTIHGGSNNETVGGVAGVTMIGGTGGNQFFDASQGHQSVPRRQRRQRDDLGGGDRHD